MKLERLWALILGLTLSLGTLAALPAGAQTSTSFPTSAHSPQGRPWTVMHANSFEATPASARAQCERTARLSRTDALRLAQCARFEAMLTAGECQTVMVPDGIVFDYMNFRRNNVSSVQRGALKQLGSTTEAQLCDIGNGVTAYFFSGQDGCKNAAFVLPPPTPPTPRAPVCTWVTTDRSHTPPTPLFVPGLDVCGCVHLPGIFTVVPGTTSTTRTLVCN